MQQKKIPLIGALVIVGLLVGLLLYNIGVNVPVTTAHSKVISETVSQPSDTPLPSGSLTRHINNPLIPMGVAGSIDDEKTGPRAVLKESATSYKMWYEAVPDPNASTVGYATSIDGKTWVKQGSVLSPSAVWEGGASGEISPNTVLVEGGVYKMWYHSFGFDGRRRIGYATSPNGTNWTKNPNPVLDVGAAGAFDDYMVTEPRVFNLGNGQYRMYYGALRQSQQGIGVYRLMTATSSNGINWVKQNQVLFGPVDSGFGIVKDGSQWHMWYGLFDRLAYASSTDGLTWTQGPNNPVLTSNPNPAAPDNLAVGDSVSAYKDGNEFRVMYTGGRYNSYGRNESICLATITVTATGCSYSISSTSQNFPAAGGAGSTGISTTGGCPWTATTDESWITINSSAGTGSGAVSFTVRANMGAARKGTISLGGQVFTVAQSAGTTVTVSRTPFDFDGDGRADISVYRPADGGWYHLNSTSGFNSLQFGISTDKPAPADYDGDGKTDIAVYRNGTWYLNRSQDGFLAIGFGTIGDISVPADFDGDGKAELAVYRPSNGVWYVLSLVNNQFYAVQFGISTDKPVVGDYDGDGKADYAVYRPENGGWYLLQSSAGFTAIQFGIAADKPVSADYDGDGKTDVAVYRSGSWYLLQSTAGFAVVPFGLLTDKPTPADYDGDGKADFAVFRNGTWHLLRSSDGFITIGFGVSSDNPIPAAFVY